MDNSKNYFGSFFVLATELLHLILSFLDIRSLLNCSHINTAWKVLTDCDSIWKQFFFQCWTPVNTQEPTQNITDTPKDEKAEQLFAQELKIIQSCFPGIKDSIKMLPSSQQRQERALDFDSTDPSEFSWKTKFQMMKKVSDHYQKLANQDQKIFKDTLTQYPWRKIDLIDNLELAEQFQLESYKSYKNDIASAKFTCILNIPLEECSALVCFSKRQDWDPYIRSGFRVKNISPKVFFATVDFESARNVFCVCQENYELSNSGETKVYYYSYRNLLNDKYLHQMSKLSKNWPNFKMETEKPDLPPFLLIGSGTKVEKVDDNRSKLTYIGHFVQIQEISEETLDWICQYRPFIVRHMEELYWNRLRRFSDESPELVLSNTVEAI